MGAPWWRGRCRRGPYGRPGPPPSAKVPYLRRRHAVLALGASAPVLRGALWSLLVTTTRHGADSGRALRPGADRRLSERPGPGVDPGARPMLGWAHHAHHLTGGTHVHLVEPAALTIDGRLARCAVRRAQRGGLLGDRGELHPRPGQRRDDAE